MLHTHSFRTMILAAFALLCGAACSEATPITLPPGLAPGTEYRILFVTSTTRQATSDDISTYNAFVTAAANAVPELAALGVTWTVLGSTAAVNALDNAALDPADATTQFFNTRGERIAVGVTTPQTGLFGGNFTNHENRILDEFGHERNEFVFTGTLRSGFTDPNSPLGAVFVRGGIPLVSHLNWTEFDSFPQSSALYLYGISAPLAAPVPEPATASLFVLAAILLIAARTPTSLYPQRRNK